MSNVITAYMTFCIIIFLARIDLFLFLILDYSGRNSLIFFSMHPESLIITHTSFELVLRSIAIKVSAAVMPVLNTRPFLNMVSYFYCRPPKRQLAKDRCSSYAFLFFFWWSLHTSSRGTCKRAPCSLALKNYFSNYNFGQKSLYMWPLAGAAPWTAVNFHTILPWYFPIFSLTNVAFICFVFTLQEYGVSLL